MATSIRFVICVSLVACGVGFFARLRSDAPHKVDHANRERELGLNPGDRLIDKCHFHYREIHNVLVWQVNRNAGGLGKAETYLSDVLQKVVLLPFIAHSDRLDDILNGDVYELEFSFSRPASSAIGTNAPIWNQSAMQLINDVHAAKGSFFLRAPRHGSLADKAKRWVSQMLNAPGVVNKVKVRLTDETQLIDVVTAPLRESFEVNLQGVYPQAADVFVELERAYDRQRDRIARHR